jgi:hypothetical protein
VSERKLCGAIGCERGFGHPGKCTPDLPGGYRNSPSVAKPSAVRSAVAITERQIIERMARTLIEAYVEYVECRTPQRKKVAEAKFNGLVQGAHFALILTPSTHIGASPFAVELDVYERVTANPPPDTIAKRTAWSKEQAVHLALLWKPLTAAELT